MKSRETTLRPRLPLGILVIAAVGVVAAALPIVALVAAVDVARVPELVTSPSSLAALWLSAGTTLATTALCILVGVPIALALGRSTFRGKAAVRILVLVPVLLPPVVAGVALSSAFGRRGLLGPWLAAAGLEVPFSTLAVVLAQTFVAMPLMVLSLEGALARSSDAEQSAADLGAGPWFRLWHVTLPSIAPALRLGTLLVAARALGEFGATLTFAGSLEGVTRTVPLEIALQRELDPAAATTLSVALLAVALVLLVTAYAAPRATATTSAPPTDAVSEPVSHGPASEPVGVHVRMCSTVRGIDAEVDIAAGERVAIMGPNGQGKSSLLDAIAGNYVADSTVVQIGTRIVTDTATRTMVPARDRGTVLLRQRSALLAHWSVLDNVALGLRARGVPLAAARAKAADMLDHAGIAALASRRPSHISGGQQQRALLARALVLEPRVLLLDEPFDGLDKDAKAQARAAVEKLTEGITTVLVTHDIDDTAIAARTLNISRAEMDRTA